MQEMTKREMQEVKALVRAMLIVYPETRDNDDLLYHRICSEKAAQAGVDIRTVHFSTVFLGNPLDFPRYASVVRYRRMIQRAQPELEGSRAVTDNRRKKEADMVELARSEGAC